MENLNELIPIQENNGKKAVSARALYEFLSYNKAVWKRWYEKNILNNAYAEENVDWEGFNIELNGNETMDFALSIKFAKKLSMMAKTEKGEQARNYFIACEEMVTNQQQKQLSPIEMQMEMLKSMQFQLQEILQTKGEIKLLKSEVEEIKQRTITDLHCSTIVAYVTRHNIKLDVKQYPVMGRKASSLCKKRDVYISKVNDVRGGNVSVYPDDILDEVFSGN